MTVLNEASFIKIRATVWAVYRLQGNRLVDGLCKWKTKTPEWEILFEYSMCHLHDSLLFAEKLKLVCLLAQNLKLIAELLYCRRPHEQSTILIEIYISRRLNFDGRDVT